MLRSHKLAAFVLIAGAGAYAFMRPRAPAPASGGAEPAAVPIYVWIQPASEVPGWTARDTIEAEQAFDAWNGVAPGVQFAFSDDSANAAVRVTWIDRFDESKTGETRLVRDRDGNVTDAAVRLAVHHADGRPVEGDAMRALAMHEVGHLLGLSHSGDPASIMAPVVHVRALSANDSAALRRSELGKDRE